MMMSQIPAPRRLCPTDPNIPAVLSLVQDCFAYMEPRIDPPSSMYALTEAKIADHCAQQEVWAIGTPPSACVFLTTKPDCLYVGKLAVEATLRGQGVARRLIQLAEDRAKAKALPALELETRIELTENHAAFQRLGFTITAEGRHEGYDRTTYVVMRKEIV